MSMILSFAIRWQIRMGVSNHSPREMVRMIKHGGGDVITQKEYYKHPLTKIYQRVFHTSFVAGVKLVN